MRENYSFKSKPKSRQAFFNTLFEPNEKYSNAFFHPKVVNALCWLEVEYLNLGPIPPAFRGRSSQEEFDELKPQLALCTPTIYLNDTVKTIQLMIMKQNHEDQMQVIEKRIEVFIKGIKIIYAYSHYHDSISEDIESFWEFIKDIMIQSILWKYDASIIKDALVKNVLYRSFSEDAPYQYFFSGMENLVKRKFFNIHNSSTGAPITLNEQIFPELLRKCEEEYSQLTISRSFSQINLSAAIIASMTILASLALFHYKSSPLALIPLVPGSFFTRAAFKTKQKIPRNLSPEALQRFFDEFMANGKTPECRRIASQLSAQMSAQMSAQQFLTIMNEASQKQTLIYMFDYQVQKYRIRTFLRRIPTKRGEEKVLFARQDIIEAYEDEASEQMESGPTSAHRYYAERSINIDVIRAKENTRRAAEQDETQAAPSSRVARPLVAEEQVFQWGAAYFTVTCILPYHSPSGGLQFIALAERTLRTQIEEAGYDANDLFGAFKNQFDLAAAGGTGGMFKKLDICSNRPVKIADVEEAGHFEHQLAIKRKGHGGESRVFFHTVENDDRPPLYLGCWFSKPGLHQASDKRKFQSTTSTVEVDNHDISSVVSI